MSGRAAVTCATSSGFTRPMVTMCLGEASVTGRQMNSDQTVKRFA